MRKRILVSGGAGFVGSHLCELLLETDAEVICVDNFSTAERRNIEPLLRHRRFELIRHDINQALVVEVDEIYHLACPASPVQYQRNPVRTIRTGVHGTLNMLDMAREVGARILIASTSEVYGDPQQHPQRESYWGHVNPIGPRACYDEAKRCAEALTVCYARQYGVQTRIARIFNTYGPRMHEDDGRVVSNFIVQALRDDPLTLYGDGGQTRSFCYVQDLIRGLMSLMALGDDPGPVNLGNPDETTIWELADRVRAITETAAPVIYKPLPTDDPVRRRPDITRAEELLGWRPTIPLEEGLRRTVAYFEELLGPRFEHLPETD